MEKHIKELVDKLFESACGYGLAEENIQPRGYEILYNIIDSIDKDNIDDFMYTLYRIAEKTGSDGFDVDA